MRNLAFFVWVLISLSGCGSVAMLEKRLPLLNGQPAEEAIKAFGAAYQKSTTSDGSQYRWIRRGSATNGVVGVAGVIVDTHTGPTECILTLNADKSGRIVKSFYEGDDSMCASFDIGMRKYLESKA